MPGRETAGRRGTEAFAVLEKSRNVSPKNCLIVASAVIPGR